MTEFLSFKGILFITNKQTCPLVINKIRKSMRNRIVIPDSYKPEKVIVIGKYPLHIGALPLLVQ
jgi:hypothetical protein